jgi:hypothetical protein
VEQKALELRYDPEINRWSTHRCLVHMDSKPLDEVSFPEHMHPCIFACSGNWHRKPTVCYIQL